MTDITELAQSLKAAAEKATPGLWEAKLGDEVYATNDGVDYEQVAIATLDARDADFIALANPANVKQLVDALEKALRANVAQDDHINQQQDRIEQLEKGHEHSAKQINSWRRLAKQSIAEQEKCVTELDVARQRITDLEFIRTSADKVQREFADELGCAGDNESILQAIDDLKKQLESRTVKLLDCDLAAVQHMSGGSTDYCNGFVDGTQNAIRAITAAGIKWEGE